MATFRFRAAVALDLRRAQETEALAAKGRAEARFYEAHQALLATERGREDAQRTLVEVGRRGSDLETLLWHRNWIVRLGVSVDERRRDLEDRARDVHAADAAWHDARRRRLALERMRDRALQRFRQHELRQEMKAMDELARIRYAISDASRSES